MDSDSPGPRPPRALRASGALLALSSLLALAACSNTTGWIDAIWAGESVRQYPLPPGASTVASPVFNPSAGSYSLDQSVALSCATPGAAIHVTIDGSAPTAASPLYSTPITVAGDGAAVTVRAFASLAGLFDSPQVSALIQINYLQVSTAQFSPVAGNYSSDQSVAVSCPTPGATIHYTTDGSPATTLSAVYSAPLPVAGNGTSLVIKILAVKAGMADNAAQAAYSIFYPTLPAPTFGTAPGSYNAAQSIAVACAEPGATIRYTTDGSAPTAASPIYSAPIPVNPGDTTTIRAFASKAGFVDSPEASGIWHVRRWELLGSAGFSAGTASHLSLAIHAGTPYLAYQDGGNGNRASVMAWNGSAWLPLGAPGLSAGPASYCSLVLDIAGTPWLAYSDSSLSGGKAAAKRWNGSVWLDVGSPAGFTPNIAAHSSLAVRAGEPYLAFKDNAAGQKTSVMRYSAGSWGFLGSPGISTGQADCQDLAFNALGDPVVAFAETSAAGGKASAKKYNGSAWVDVGAPQYFSAGATADLDLGFGAGGVPMLAYQDNAAGNATTLQYWNGAVWQTLGPSGFSVSAVNYVALAVDQGSGAPFVAYGDLPSGIKATVKVWDGSAWATVGAPAFSAGSATWLVLDLDATGRPYVAFNDGANGNKATVMVFK